jgi:3-phenylpropionate/trans-cinnamate dioxygenase ferredoxin reductase subunit
MLGVREPFRDVPFFWTTQYDLTVNYVGHAESLDRAELAGDQNARDALVAYLVGNEIRAIATVGRDRAALAAEAAIERGDQRALRALLDG